MDIDITDLKSRDIIKILQNYPQGNLEVKFERIFWCSDYLEPESKDNHAGEPPTRGGPHNQKPQRAMERMADTLGSMMGPPQQPRMKREDFY